MWANSFDKEIFWGASLVSLSVFHKVGQLAKPQEKSEAVQLSGKQLLPQSRTDFQ